ncbi:DUF1338 domain-containing protein [Dyadobacter chenwenxiniae]|uniref:2-oxoadipate dioxygenase/decarboxylase n=1 Tax=Dyadobacter chenwenxiniae TaxID=2906456 RepID=A0A9X1PRW5_9BACT|nr:DUF1338 domain-containing protein [Dyadobacter chenwenxiniae]MCF0051215.1 DUF1338 domain-containing protein [Dyadobacter chenwenxiniae]MCF0064533.1 DUF1338 domain-containing protein [Dyadobacter chenwenxiniae]UON82265.1 DUF1338 domain-containing protein [Dyadobacter chenwenxiniae]
MSHSHKFETLDVVLNGLMRRYKERVPDVSVILNAMVADGVVNNVDDIENDHIAFRTMGVPNLGVRSFEKIFLHYGYEKRDHYFFEGKKLDAWWFSPPRETDPRIFVSELRVNDLSEESQRIITSYTNEVTTDPVDALDLDNGVEVDAFLHRPLWRTPTVADYQSLLHESEYAAWVIYNRYYLNHFTISVHNLPDGYNTVAAFNEFLEKNGIRLNTSGGKIKISPDGGLLQSATIAEMIHAEFANGEHLEISGSYVEFAERKVLPHFQNIPPAEITRRHRRDGFEAANADKIFESTYTTQTRK